MSLQRIEFILVQFLEFWLILGLNLPKCHEPVVSLLVLCCLSLTRASPVGHFNSKTGFTLSLTIGLSSIYLLYIYYFWLPLPLPSAVQCSSTVLCSQEIPSLPSLTTGTGTVGGDMGKEAYCANFFPGKKYLRDFMEVDYLKGFSMTPNFCWN